MLFRKSDFNHTQELEAKLSALNKSQAVIEFNMDSTIITANENFLNAMGYRLDEVQGRRHSIFVDPTYLGSGEYKEFWDDLRAGHFQAAQYKRLSKSGKDVWIEASYNPIFNKDGEPYKVVKFATDITAQKMINLEFEGKMNALDKAQAIIEFNLDGTIITANENFLATLGYSLDEIKGKHHSMFVDTAYGASSEYKKFWEDLRAGNFQASKYKRFGKNKKEIWIEASYNPIFDFNGKVYKVVKFATDITNAVQKISSIKMDMQSIDAAVLKVNAETGSAAGAANETATSVQTVAAGAEELHASVVEISQTMAKTSQATDEAYRIVIETDAETKKLTDAAQAMSGIVGLIEKIAEQVNLLSLNATIEAARAGDAGKGFAVVASEVKNLATQVGEATQKISGEINNVQHVVAVVAKGLQSILGTIDNARGYVSGVAGAVEEQSAVTRDMSSNIQIVSQAMNDVSGNLSSIVTTLRDVKESVNQTKVAADNII